MDNTTQAPNEVVARTEPRATLQQVLAEARSLTPFMFEAQDMCLHVLERFQSITDQVEALGSPTSLPAINRFIQILKDYLEFLKKNSRKLSAIRLVYNHAVVNQNFAFHDQIDNLLRGLNLPEDAWKERWEGFKDAQLAAFEMMSRTRMKLIGDLRDAQAQTEALTLFLFEYRYRASKYTPKELKVLNNAFSIVSQFSKNKAPTIATWFLPPYEFQCEETPFAWGSYGTVHHGKHCGSDVVVKRAKIASEADRAAFVREASAWFSANQIPNVVRLFGAYHVGMEPYFVCEYAANGTLNDYLFKEENRQKTWQLLLEAARGLRALHKLNIVHNDLKGDNILVATDGIAKLTDFGLSSQMSAQQALSVMKDVGAIRWKAPEIIAGTSPPSFFSDVYSFAMCIYEAVSHTKPWGNTPDIMVQKNVKRGILPGRPDDVFTDAQWTLLEQMCTLSPDERTPMDEVVKQLEVFRDEQYNDIHTPQAGMKPLAGDLGNGTPGEPCPEPIPDAPRPADPLLQIPECPLSAIFVVDASVANSQISTEGGKRVAKYEVHLKLSNNEVIEVWKRYSNFRFLHDYLQRNFCDHMSKFPRFPKRKAFWSTLSDSTIVQRKTSLDKFLKNVISSSELPLGIVIDAQTTLYKSVERPEVVL